MTITQHNIVRHELVSLPVRISKSTDPTLNNLRGKVIDETYNTIRIETKDKKEKIIPKKNTIFIFTLPNRLRVEIDGKVLIGRPEDRIKKKFVRW